MAMTAAELIKADQDHLIHPLHHPIDHAEPMIYVRGRGATIEDYGGQKYIDGLAGLWNVNVGHGRAELAEAAAEQIKEIAYFSAYTGSSNVPAITLYCNSSVNSRYQPDKDRTVIEMGALPPGFCSAGAARSAPFWSKPSVSSCRSGGRGPRSPQPSCRRRPKAAPLPPRTPAAS